jgi:hypothetical protein
MRLGEVLSKTFDTKGYERRVRVEAIAACPMCGKDVAMLSETEEWRQEKNGPRWLHQSYDCCSTGECCGQVIIFNGLEGKLLTLNPQTPAQTGGEGR